MLCGSGVLAALILAWPMVAVLGRYAARFSVRAEGLKLDFSLVWFGIALALSGGGVPGAHSTAALRERAAGRWRSRAAEQGLTGGSSRRLRIFAIMQITASFLLLTGAAVLMRTLYVLEKTQPPFDTARVTRRESAGDVVWTNTGAGPGLLPRGAAPSQRPARGGPRIDGFQRSVARRSGAEYQLRVCGTGSSTRKNGLDDWRAKFRSVSPGYFETLGLPIVQGRDFRDADKNGSERVVIVSQSLAQTLFPGQEAVNRDLRWTDGVMKFVGISMEPRRIVGVVPDLDDENIIPSPAMMVYQPTDQEGWQGRLFVRAEQDPYALAPAITRTIHEISAEQPVERVSTLKDIRAEVLTPDRLNAVVFGGFAAVALLISVVGVAGVLAFSVSGRTREFGIRMALGAQPRNILTDVLLQGLTIAGIGVGAGVVFGIVFARGISRYVAEAHLPGMLAFVASAFVILAAAVIASAVPAARAARVNAVEALRSE